MNVPLRIKLLFVTAFLLIFSGQNNACAQSNQEVKLVQQYSKEKSPPKRFWKLYELAKYYQRTNYHKADSIRESLIALSYSANDSARFVAQVYDADRDMANGNLESYYSKILELQPFINQLPSAEVKIDIYKKLAEYNLYMRETTSANTYLKEALTLCRKNREIAKACEIYQLLSQEYMLLNNMDSATYFARQAIIESKRAGDELLKADLFHNQATIHAYFGQEDLSASKNAYALSKVEREGDLMRIAKYSLNIGEAQLNIKNFKEAELYFLMASDNAERLKDYRTYALAQVNLGVMYRETGDVKKALELLRKAMRLIKTFDNDGLGFAHSSIGDIYRQEKDFISAQRHYNTALYYYEKSGNRQGIATVFHNVGFVFEQQGKYLKALNHLKRSAEIRSQSGFKGSVYITYQTIADVYYKLGNTQMAYKYLKLYSDYADSAKANDAIAKMLEYSTMYRTEQYRKDQIVKAEEISRLNQERELNSARTENLELKTNLQTYVILGFVIFMLLGGIIGFYRWNQTKIKQQQQQAEMNQTLLRAQMNPHFVFNAMSVIQSYIYDNDTKNSAKFLVNFSKLMRLILENSSKESIPIKIEYDILEKYLNIQKLRFEERFEFKIKVDETLYEEDAVIPPMITQPFIENAIEHGRLHLREDGFIHIHFFKFENMLRITVEDNGVGRKGAELNKKSKEHKSMAMKITRDRIDNLNKKYRSDGFLLIEDFNKVEETGTKVLISIPYRVNNQI